MSTDRELLELAAKAAGLDLIQQYAGRCIVYEEFKGDSRKPVRWSPLTDDGDALRLAVKLKIDIDFNSSSVEAWHWAGIGDDTHVFLDQPFDEDPLAATRLAIVRGAAEIGRKMP